MIFWSIWFLWVIQIAYVLIKNESLLFTTQVCHTSDQQTQSTVHTKNERIDRQSNEWGNDGPKNTNV